MFLKALSFFMLLFVASWVNATPVPATIRIENSSNHTVKFIVNDMLSTPDMQAYIKEQAEMFFNVDNVDSLISSLPANQIITIPAHEFEDVANPMLAVGNWVLSSNILSDNILSEVEAFYASFTTNFLQVYVEDLAFINVQYDNGKPTSAFYDLNEEPSSIITEHVSYSNPCDTFELYNGLQIDYMNFDSSSSTDVCGTVNNTEIGITNTNGPFKANGQIVINYNPIINE